MYPAHKEHILQHHTSHVNLAQVRYWEAKTWALGLQVSPLQQRKQTFRPHNASGFCWLSSVEVQKWAWQPGSLPKGDTA
jgi:hypothetical protein